MNEIQLFSNPQFGEIRTVMDEQCEPMFCLADLCKVLDLTAKTVNQRLGDEVVSKYPIEDALGRTQQALFVNEDGLYDVILESRKPIARTFRKWVTSEVLPSIRKTGKYEVGYQIPQTFAEALRLAADQQEQIEEQQKLIGIQAEQITDLSNACDEMRVKVSYYDQILASKNTVTTTQIAQDYGMSAKKFNVELRNMKIQRKVGGQWILYAPYNTMGYVHSETFVPEKSKSGKVVMLTKWSQKGRLFLYEELKKKGILPLIEQ